MKKALSLILALILCLSLCACGKSDATKSVEAQIETLTNITYDDKERVAAVRLSYNNLLPEEKEDVENLSVLLQAEQIIVEEGRKLIDSIVADYAPSEAISLLRQIENSGYAKSQIRALGVKLLQNYVLDNGYQSDYRGRPETDDDYKSVSVSDYSDTFYFVASTDRDSVMERDSVYFVYRDESAVNRLLKSQYSVDRRDHSLMIFGDSGHFGFYLETEWINEGWKYAGYVSWDAHISPLSDLNSLSPDIESGNALFWPYSESEDYLEENCKLHVKEYIEQMNACLATLDFPVTGWELLGFMD